VTRKRSGFVTNALLPPVYTSTMSRRTQLMLTDRQHAFLADESNRTGLAMAELIRRAIDKTYRPHARPAVRGFELSLGLWDRPPAAIAGRRRIGV
jgi:hypothetical protein